MSAAVCVVCVGVHWHAWIGGDQVINLHFAVPHPSPAFTLVRVFPHGFDMDPVLYGLSELLFS